MEPSLIKNNKGISKQTKILLIITILALSIFIGTSYSILTSSDETEEVITFQAGDLNLEVKTNTDSTINFQDELPKSEVDVETPVILNIRNSGSLTICEYRLKLVADTEDSTQTSDLSTSYIRYAVSLDNGASYRVSKLLSETNSQIYIGLDLKPEATKTIYLKVWIDESALDNEDILDTSFYGKIDAELLQRCETPATEIVKATIGETGGIIGVTNDNQKVTNDTDNIREYRYSGLGVNNYVTFNNETWRIIGIFKDEKNEEHIKLVRNEILKDYELPNTYESNGIIFNIGNGESNVYWNKKPDYAFNNDYNNWGNASLMNWLNSTGTENGYLKTLSSNAQNMITETKYYLGNIVLDADNPIQSYEHERGSTPCNGSCKGGDVWPNNAATWIGKIALMYSSDYGFSGDSGSWKTIFGDYVIKESSWLYKDSNHINNEWLLSACSGAIDCVTCWDTAGGIFAFSPFYGNLSARPVLYLKSEVTITSGNGSSEKPYQLKLN